MDIVDILNESGPSHSTHACTWTGCSKGFKNNSDLTRHTRIHTKERPYKCDVCGKAFAQKSAVKVHMRTHTGERPHLCTWMNCGKRFADSSSLGRHRRVHTGRRGYSCAYEDCGRSFCRKNTLVNHARDHRNHAMVPKDAAKKKAASTSSILLVDAEIKSEDERGRVDVPEFKIIGIPFKKIQEGISSSFCLASSAFKLGAPYPIRPRVHGATNSENSQGLWQSNMYCSAHFSYLNVSPEVSEKALAAYPSSVYKYHNDKGEFLLIPPEKLYLA